jgi:ABC-type antimicrobial peptide transport system permease subunit
MAAALRRAVAEVDPEQPVTKFATMASIVADSLGWRRFNMFLLGVFALAAMVMAAVGLLGVLSFSVAQRTSEMGIKLALGARAGLVVRQVVWEGVRLSLIGLCLGGAGALGATRLMSSMVYGVNVNDPLTFVLAAALLAVTAVLATVFPALHAARVDPMRALQAE